jgi:hypothetical protein
MQRSGNLYKAGDEGEMSFLYLDLFLYSIILFCSVYGAGMFILWWLKIGQVSYIYKVFTFLLIGLSAETSGTLVAVVFKYWWPHELINIVTAWWWPLRLIVPALCLIAFVLHITWRFAHMDKDGSVNYGRRKDD